MVPASARVELDIYSGRPNPSWTLPAPATADFVRLLTTLPATAPFEAAAPLGYRGFVVTWQDSSAQQAAIVQSGRVKWTSDGRSRYLVDSGRSLERWLLESGRDHLDPAVSSMVDQALGRPPPGST